MAHWPGLLNYWVAIGLFVIGLMIVIDSTHLLKKLVGLSIFQSAVFLLFITMGKVAGGHAPILPAETSAYIMSNPLPHVLILTAIVVGVATTAVGLALVVRIRRAFGSVHEPMLYELHEPPVPPEQP